MKTPSKLKLSRQEVAWPEWAHTPTTPTDNQPKDQFYGSFRKKITDLDMKKDEKRNDNKKYLKYISKKKK